MSRITGMDAANLIEAYNAVYAPQEEVELTEEQVQEDFENWVNSLVEDGHDLSEYTWEDMYEAYIEEQGRNRTPQATIDANRAALGNTILYGNPAGRTPPKPTAQQQMRQKIQANRPGTTTSSAKPTPSAPQNLRGLSIGPGGFNINGRPVQTAPTRPSTPAATAPAPAPARPAAQTSARPAPAPAPKPQLGPSSKPLVGGIERRTPTSAELRQAQQLRTAGSNLTGTGALAPSNTLSTAARNLSGTGALATRTATPAPAPVSAPKPNLQQQIRQRRLNMDLDLFDIVQGYLIDEGYAETEEAAAIIMANMSEEWKQSIVEQSAIASRAAAVVDDQRRGSHGMAHDQKMTGDSIKKLNRYKGPRVTPGLPGA